jgi:hypothetical protein
MYNFFLVRIKSSEKREKHTISADDLPCLGVIICMYSYMMKRGVRRFSINDHLIIRDRQLRERGSWAVH